MKFDFNDINLVPKKCIVHSRNECSTKVKLGDHEFNIPIIPANMECVIDEKIAINLFNNGYFYIMHRFGDTYLFMKKLKKLGILTSISIGVNEDSYQLLNKLLHENLIPDYITIDIAHGHSVLVEKMIKYLKLNFTSFIIAGNISTSEAIIDLESWGADATKVGIGPGSACTTYPATGFGSRNCQASVIYECSKVATKPIIADGGIMDIKKNDYIKNSFELTLTLTGLFDKFIRGDVEYNKYLSMSTRTHFSGKAMQVYNTYTSEYTDRGVNTSGYSKKLEVLFMSLEEFNIRYTDVEIDQNVSKEIEYWPYVRIKIKVDNEKLEKLINLVWDDDIKIPPLSQSSSLSRGRSYR